MSELINQARQRKDMLKHLIKQLHQGEAPEAVKKQLVQLLGKVPYGDVVEVEQELIAEGMPAGEILKLCDVHSKALRGAIEHTGARQAPSGHPVHTFIQENRALGWELNELVKLFEEIGRWDDNADASGQMMKIHARFNALNDVIKHYQRKENLLFPFLEKHGVTGPSKVMWGKHNEVREFLKSALETLNSTKKFSGGDAKGVVHLVLQPTAAAIEEMIFKEEEILFPMALDTLTEQEWYEIYQQSAELGFCLYDPTTIWKPETLAVTGNREEEQIKLSSGSFTPQELTAILNTIPFDLTFVDKDDTVRYFTQGQERIFARNRAILGRKVQMCHPPSSIQVVEQIIADFKSNKHNRAAFWITLGGKFISIEYFALRGSEGEYLGVLEVSQDLTEKRKLEGERRLLSYEQQK